MNEEENEEREVISDEAEEMKEAMMEAAKPVAAMFLSLRKEGLSMFEAAAVVGEMLRSGGNSSNSPDIFGGM